MTTKNQPESLVSYERKQRMWSIIQSQYFIKPVLAVSIALFLSPLVWELITSLQTNEATQALNYLPSNPTLQTFSTVLIEKSYWKPLKNTFIIASVSTVIVVMLATPAGYVFSRFRFPFDDIIFIAIILSRLFPPIGLIIPYFDLMSSFDLLDTLYGIILAHVYLWLPLAIYMMRNFFMSIPNVLNESAQVDGCTKFQAFRKIIFPLAMPGFAATTILTFLYSWKEFLFALVIGRTPQSIPISVGVYQFVGDVNVKWAEIAAAGIISILPALLVIVLFQKYIVSGLVGGAVKG